MVCSEFQPKGPEDLRSTISDDDRMLYLMDEISRRARRSYDLSVAELGLNRTQWRIIGLLLQEPDLTQGEIAKRLELESATIGQAVMALCKRGVTEREKTPSDWRVWKIRFTDDIKELLPQLRLAADRLHEALWMGFKPDEKAMLRRLLDQLSKNLTIIPNAID